MVWEGYRQSVGLGVKRYVVPHCGDHACLDRERSGHFLAYDTFVSLGLESGRDVGTLGEQLNRALAPPGVFCCDRDQVSPLHVRDFP